MSVDFKVRHSAYCDVCDDDVELSVRILDFVDLAPRYRKIGFFCDHGGGCSLGRTDPERCPVYQEYEYP